MRPAGGSGPHEPASPVGYREKAPVHERSPMLTDTGGPSRPMGPGKIRRQIDGSASRSIQHAPPEMTL
jgi:hypothetical protein